MKIIHFFIAAASSTTTVITVSGSTRGEGNPTDRYGNSRPYDYVHLTTYDGNTDVSLNGGTSHRHKQQRRRRYRQRRNKREGFQQQEAWRGSAVVQATPPIQIVRQDGAKLSVRVPACIDSTKGTMHVANNKRPITHSSNNNEASSMVTENTIHNIYIPTCNKPIGYKMNGATDESMTSSSATVSEHSKASPTIHA